MQDDRPLSATFGVIAEYCVSKGLAPIKDKILSVKIDDHWELCVNGFSEERDTGPFGQSKASHKIGPFSAYVEFNGWPAGEFNPYGGCFAAGELANEETFCEVLKKEIANVSG